MIWVDVYLGSVLGTLDLVGDGTELVEGAFEVDGSRLVGSGPSFFKHGEGHGGADVVRVGGSENSDGEGNVGTAAPAKGLF